MEFKSYREIVVNVKPGVYYFDSESATGKTFMCKMLAKLKRKDVIVITYDNEELIKSESELDSLINKKNTKLVMLDRYDMYVGKFDNVMNRHRNNVIFLVDCKKPYKMKCEAKWCAINMTDKKVEVSDYDYVRG